MTVEGKKWKEYSCFFWLKTKNNNINFLNKLVKCRYKVML